MGTSSFPSMGSAWTSALREQRTVGSLLEGKEREGDLKKETEVGGGRRHLGLFRDGVLVKEMSELEVAAIDGDERKL